MMDFTACKSKREKKKHLIKSIKSLFYRILFDNGFQKSNFELDIFETVCVNPECRIEEPHTFINFFFCSGGYGSFAIPLALNQIDNNSCVNYLPHKDIITSWSNGIRAEWPPKVQVRFSVGTIVLCKIREGTQCDWVHGKISALFHSEPNWSPHSIAPYQIELFNGNIFYAEKDSDDIVKLPNLRFSVGDRVECNINSKTYRGWNYGRVVKLFYYESDWPPEYVAPYQVRLHTGDFVFSPYDDDDCIRLRPEAPHDAPSSPEIDYSEEED